MTKLKMMATGLVAAGLVTSAGVGLVSGRQETGPRPGGGAETAKVALPDAAKAVRPPDQEPAEPPRPQPRQESVTAPGGSAADSPRVLSVRLQSAIEAAQIRQRLFEKAAIPYTEVLSAQAEVHVLLAQLESRRDDLQDQIELLKAELSIRQADVAAADAQYEIASFQLERDDRLVQQKVVSKGERKVPEQNLALRAAERAKRQAEVAEVRIRIEQATRQLKTVEDLLKVTYKMITKASLMPGQNDPLAPPAAR